MILFFYILNLIFSPDNSWISCILVNINVNSPRNHFKLEIEHQNVNVYVIRSVLIPILPWLALSFFVLTPKAQSSALITPEFRVFSWKSMSVLHEITSNLKLNTRRWLYTLLGLFWYHQCHGLYCYFLFLHQKLNFQCWQLLNFVYFSEYLCQFSSKSFQTWNWTPKCECTRC